MLTRSRNQTNKRAVCQDDELLGEDFAESASLDLCGAIIPRAKPIQIQNQCGSDFVARPVCPTRFFLPPGCCISHTP